MRAALWGAFPRPPSSKVERLCRLGWEREGYTQVINLVGGVAGVGDCCVRPDNTRDQQRDGECDGEGGIGVGCVPAGSEITGVCGGKVIPGDSKCGCPGLPVA